MESNLADTLLEIDSEDIADIYHMVSEWEFNFGSLEGSDNEELFAVVQLENQQSYGVPSPNSTVPSSAPVFERKSPPPPPHANYAPAELHDRLPSYYTALAPSRSAPWIQPCNNQVFSKLPAYITDVASLDVLTGGPCERPGKKKLNLAEYRTRRERQMQQKQEEVDAADNVSQPSDNPSEQEAVQKVVAVKVEEKPNASSLQGIKLEAEQVNPIVETPGVGVKIEPGLEPVAVKAINDEKAKHSANDASSSRAVEEKASSSKDADQRFSSRRESTRSRRKSSRSPTRSFSSQSSRSPSPRRRRRHRSSSRSSRSSYSSRSRSRSPSYRSRRQRSSRSRSRSWRGNRSYSRRRSPSPKFVRDRYSECRRVPYDHREVERQRQIEERRVIYVGKIAEGTTRSVLRRRFEAFGPVIDVSLHFRDRGDNYGFVTFAYKVDAYEAVEHGNDDPTLPKYDLSFGGRRAFCKEQYADLDAADEDRHMKASDVDFETLLRAVQAQLHRRPCS